VGDLFDRVFDTTHPNFIPSISDADGKDSPGTGFFYKDIYLRRDGGDVVANAAVKDPFFIR
jgi:hypothetical protein